MEPRGRTRRGRCGPQRPDGSAENRVAVRLDKGGRGIVGLVLPSRGRALRDPFGQCAVSVGIPAWMADQPRGSCWDAFQQWAVRWHVDRRRRTGDPHTSEAVSPPRSDASALGSRIQGGSGPTTSPINGFGGVSMKHAGVRVGTGTRFIYDGEVIEI